MSSLAEADQVMYECGLETLHPGGLEKTDEMARACGVGPATRVLDLGGGRGTTACHLARTHGCAVVGIDVSQEMVEAAQRRVRAEGLERLVTFRQADAHALPFEDRSFDVVLVECVTTLLDKERALRELRRVLKPGGALGDLEMTWRREPDQPFAQRVREEWGGFGTFTLAGWEELFRSQGFEVVTAVDFSERMQGLRAAYLEKLGAAGLARLSWRLLRRPSVALRMMRWDRLLGGEQAAFGYGYVVARRPR